MTERPPRHPATDEGPDKENVLSITRDAIDAAEGTDTKRKDSPKVRRRETRTRSLQDLGAAMDEHKEKNGNHDEKNDYSMEMPVSFLHASTPDALQNASYKRFPGDTFLRPVGPQRLPDETLPEYRLRYKSALMAGVADLDIEGAGVKIRGIDTSKLSVKVPSKFRTRAQYKNEEQEIQSAIDVELDKPIIAKWDQMETKSIKSGQAYRSAIDEAARIEDKLKKQAGRNPEAKVKAKIDEIKGIKPGGKRSNERTAETTTDTQSKGTESGNNNVDTIEDGIFHEIPPGLRIIPIANHPKQEDFTSSDSKRNVNTEMERGRAESGVTAAEKAYFDEIRKYQKSRSTFGIAAENLTGELSSKKLKELRREWVRMRAGFARAQLDSVDERLKRRYATAEKILEGLKNYKGKGQFTPEEVKARYERMITLRSTVLGAKGMLSAEELEQEARMEGLNERDKGIFNKYYDRYKQWPPWARIATTSTVLFAGSAALAVGLGSGLGIAAIMLGTGKTGARILAEAKKGTGIGKASSAVSRILSVGAIAGILGETIARGVHSVNNTEKKAQELLSKQEGLGDLQSEKGFEAVSKSRKEAVGAGERVARHGRLARMAASLTGGWLFGEYMHGGHDATSTDAHGIGQTNGGAGVHPEGSGSSSGGTVGHGHGEPVRHTHGGKPESIPSTPPPSPVHEESLAIHGKVFDADSLFGHFRDQLAKEYPDPSRAPASVRAFIEHKEAQDPLTKWLGFQKEDGTSAMMHEGDTVSIQPNGELVFKTATGHSYTLFDKEGHLNKFDLSKFHTTPNPHEHVAVAAHSSPVHTESPGTDSREDATTNEDSSAPGTSAETRDANLQSGSASVGSADRPEGAPLTPTSNPGGVRTLDQFLNNNGKVDAQSTPSTPESPRASSSGSGVQTLDSFISNRSDVSGATESFTNAHNIELNVSSPQEVVWSIPNTNQNIPFVFGGSVVEAGNIAKQFATSHPGDRMLFMYEQKNALGTVTRSVGEWSSNRTGELTFTAQVLNERGQPWRIPNPDEFTRKLSG